jgi:3D (Asp-Asp-Asp) domain-containing protein
MGGLIITSIFACPTDYTNSVNTIPDGIMGLTAGISSQLNEILNTSNEAAVSSVETDTVGSGEESAIGSNEESTDVSEVEVEETIVETYTEVSPYTMYVGTSTIKLRSTPDSSTDDNVLAKLSPGTEITVVGTRDDEWVAVQTSEYGIAYVSGNYIQDSLPEAATYNYNWAGEVLNRHNGTIYGPNGKETYYNLDMSGCIRYMNDLGYYYDYWVRSDGTKMFGNWVMIAADLSVYPKGSLVETSLGTGIVVDTGDFVTNGSGVSFDIAVTW